MPDFRASTTWSARLRDSWELTKPSVTAMCVLMVVGGVAFAPESITTTTLVGVLVGTWMSVGSANALNMVFERDTDALMTRTKNRPLPDGRMSVGAALTIGICLGVVSLIILAFFVNGITAAIGCAALLSYVLIYTPLKTRTPLALIVGAFPGAAPPLMGWTAAMGTLDAPGVLLFAILLIWQIPHFLAIALYRKSDYARAGIRTVPNVRGDRVAKAQALAYSTLLIPTSLALVPLGYAGWIYGIAAAVSGGLLLAMNVQGMWVHHTARWARRFFLATLAYLPVLTCALVMEAWIR